MRQALKFVIGMIDSQIQQVLVKVSHCWQVAIIPGSARDLNANVFLDAIQVFGCDGVDVVGFPVGAIGT